MHQVHKFCSLYQSRKNIEDLERFMHFMSELSPSSIMVVSSSLNHMCMLSNIAEWTHRIRRRRAYERVSEESGYEAVQTTTRGTFISLMQAGYTPEQIRKGLLNQSIEFVLTAHPTESVRLSLLRNLRKLALMILKLDRPDLTPFEIQQVWLE